MKDAERPYDVTFDPRAGLKTNSTIESANDQRVQEPSQHDLRVRSVADTRWEIMAPPPPPKKGKKGKPKPPAKKKPAKKPAKKK